jgi:MFS family permease
MEDRLRFLRLGAPPHLVRLMLALASINLAISLMTQVIPLAMQNAGAPAESIGLNTASGQAAVFLLGLSLPLLSGRFGRKRFMVFGAVMAGLGFVGFSIFPPWQAWYVLRFMAGIGMGGVFTLAESYIQSEAAHAQRGRILGLYMTFQTVSFGMGPFLVPLTGVTGAWPFLACLFFLLAGLAGLLLQPVSDSAMARGFNFWPIIKKAPLIYVGIGMTTVFEGLFMSFFSIYAIHQGLSLAAATRLIGVGVTGCLLFFYPTGKIADHWSKLGMMMICAAIAIGGCLVLSPLMASDVSGPLVILIRAGAFGIYLICMSMIGAKFDGAELVAASSLVAVCWGLSGILAPPLAGILLDHLGLGILPVLLAACYAPVFIGTALALWQQQFRLAVS